MNIVWITTMCTKTNIQYWIRIDVITIALTCVLFTKAFASVIIFYRPGEAIITHLYLARISYFDIIKIVRIFLFVDMIYTRTITTNKLSILSWWNIHTSGYLAITKCDNSLFWIDPWCIPLIIIVLLSITPIYQSMFHLPLLMIKMFLFWKRHLNCIVWTISEILILGHIFYCNLQQPISLLFRCTPAFSYTRDWLIMTD